ncbi:coiled-coil domain-containing protein 32 isoform X2 [Ascaphus truei]
MKMIESIDCASPGSGQDMWADICPCASDSQQVNCTQAFSDSFLGASPDGTDQREFQDGNQSETLHGALQSSQKPWAPLKDSELYLASLERRLQKIKGLSHEVTSKDMLRSLGQAKKECWDRFLQETFEHEAYVGDSEVDPSTLEHLRRWLQPEKVAISAEEMQCLILAESPSEKQAHSQDSSAAEP